MGAHRQVDRWLPAAIEEFAFAATAAAEHDSAKRTMNSADDDSDSGSTEAEVVSFLSQPAPRPLDAILNDLCLRCEVEPPSCVVGAMQECVAVRWGVSS